KSILFNEQARSQFEAFFKREDTFALGVCNGCQMLSNLHELIPGAEHWPHFVRNMSEQFEARVAMVEVQESDSLFFAGMAGSRMPIAIAHGEGRAEFASEDDIAELSAGQIALRFVNNYGDVTEQYPFNPNGSPQGITGLTANDGRVTIMMPHPERVFRAIQNSYIPADSEGKSWDEDGAWMRMYGHTSVCCNETCSYLTSYRFQTVLTDLIDTEKSAYAAFYANSASGFISARIIRHRLLPQNLLPPGSITTQSR